MRVRQDALDTVLNVVHVSIHALVRVRRNYYGGQYTGGSFNPRTRESATVLKMLVYVPYQSFNPRTRESATIRGCVE